MSLVWRTSCAAWAACPAGRGAASPSAACAPRSQLRGARGCERERAGESEREERKRAALFRSRPRRQRIEPEPGSSGRSEGAGRPPVRVEDLEVAARLEILQLLTHVLPPDRVASDLVHARWDLAHTDGSGKRESGTAEKREGRSGAVGAALEACVRTMSTLAPNPAISLVPSVRKLKRRSGGPVSTDPPLRNFRSASPRSQHHVMSCC